MSKIGFIRCREGGAHRQLNHLCTISSASAGGWTLRIHLAMMHTYINHKFRIALVQGDRENMHGIILDFLAFIYTKLAAWYYYYLIFADVSKLALAVVVQAELISQLNHLCSILSVSPVAGLLRVHLAVAYINPKVTIALVQAHLNAQLNHER
jgi:hypothetical protein